MTRDAAAIARELDAPDPESRRVATQQIARLRGGDATTLLLRALGDPDWRVRKEAAAIAPGVEPRAEVIRALVDALSETENVGLRNSVVEALVGVGSDASSPAALALASLDADGRKLAVEVLGGIGDARGVEALVRSLDDPDPNVRATAAELLGNARGAGPELREVATTALIRALTLDVPLVKLSALDALVRLDAVVPWATLAPLTLDPVLRRSAIAAAGHAVEGAALLAIASAAGDSASSTARDAVVVLADQLLARPATDAARAAAVAEVLGSRRAVDRVHALARDAGDLRARGAALVILALLGDARDVALLVAGLEDEELAPRAELALRLFGASAIGPAIEAGRKSYAPVRAATLSLVPSLANPPGEFALEALREALADPDPEVVVAAISALAVAGREEDLAAVAAHATDPDLRIAGTACSALKTMVARYPRSARGLIDGASASGPHAVVGCVVAGAIAEEAGGGSEGSSDVAYLRAALDHDDVRVRRAAVDALASLDDPRAADAAAFALADEGEDVVFAAARALGRMRRPGPLRTLLRTTRVPGVASAALLALGEASLDDAFEAALPLLSQPDAALARAAVEAIGQLEGPRRDDALRLAVAHPSADVVTAALVEIARTAGGPRSALEGALEHASPDVRRVAAELLGADGTPASQASVRARLERETEPSVRDAMGEALSSRGPARGDGA